MKKFILSFALFMGFTSVQNSFAISTPAGYEAAQWMRELAEAQNDTDSSLMRKFILIKHSPKARRVLKIITSTSFALLGAWLCARGYQNWQAGEAMLYNPPVMP